MSKKKPLRRAVVKGSGWPRIVRIQLVRVLVLDVLVYLAEGNIRIAEDTFVTATDRMMHPGKAMTSALANFCLSSARHVVPPGLEGTLAAA